MLLALSSFSSSEGDTFEDDKVCMVWEWLEWRRPSMSKWKILLSTKVEVFSTTYFSYSSCCCVIYPKDLFTGPPLNPYLRTHTRILSLLPLILSPYPLLTPPPLPPCPCSLYPERNGSLTLEDANLWKTSLRMKKLLGWVERSPVNSTSR